MSATSAANASGLILDRQRRQACAKSVILQRNWRPEHRHYAVAGELVHRAAESLYHRRRALDEFAHDLAQSLGTHRGGDIHRMHDVGEQHRHLLVLGRLGRNPRR